MFDQPEHDAAAEQFELLLIVSANKLYHSPDPASYLDWISQHGPQLVPELCAQVDPATGPVALFFRALGVQIYNNMPLPDYQFSVHPLPKPERNSPCNCGSGKKYKHCCGPMELHNSPLADFNLLKYVLDYTPKNRFAELPNSKVDPEAVADAALQWLNKGDTKKALALVEPWFKQEITLTKRHRWLFDILMDIYLDEDKPLKRKRLLQRACAAEDKQLRSDAWQRKASIEMDDGDTASAWESFAKAQQLDPNAPPLALLELTLLCAEHKVEQAKARATFWLARYRRSQDVTPEFMDLLAQCTQDPISALRMPVARAENVPTVFQDLFDQLTSAPAVTKHYKLITLDNEAMLQSDKSFAKLEQQWTKAAQTNKPNLTMLTNDDIEFWHRMDEWFPLLLSKPQLWNSFEVLDDLVMGVDAILAETEFTEFLLNLLHQLLDRASALLETQLTELPANAVLPWIMQENRPALRLLAHKTELLLSSEGYSPNFIRTATRLIQLNPNDNHGCRVQLTTAHLFNGQFTHAISIASQFEEDFMCPVPLNHVLALYLDNQPTAALDQLIKIAPRFKNAINILLATNPKEPRSNSCGITAGGKEEAWIYRQDTRALWQQRGALEWLKKSLHIHG